MATTKVARQHAIWACFVDPRSTQQSSSNPERRVPCLSWEKKTIWDSNYGSLPCHWTSFLQPPLNGYAKPQNHLNKLRFALYAERKLPWTWSESLNCFLFYFQWIRILAHTDTSIGTSFVRPHLPPSEAFWQSTSNDLSWFLKAFTQGTVRYGTPHWKLQCRKSRYCSSCGKEETSIWPILWESLGAKLFSYKRVCSGLSLLKSFITFESLVSRFLHKEKSNECQFFHTRRKEGPLKEKSWNARTRFK